MRVQRNFFNFSASIITENILESLNKGQDLTSIFISSVTDWIVAVFEWSFNHATV